MGSVVERIWLAAHAAPLFPSWWAFQLVAALVGALVLGRRSPRALPAFGAGVLTAALLAFVVGSGGAWLRFLANGMTGPAPEVEIAGFGALAGLTLGYVVVARRHGLLTGGALDALAPAVGAMLAVARLGCFFAGCDFGAPSTVPWALRYPHLTPAFRAQLGAGLVTPDAVATLPVHPTQLYESVLGLVLLAIALVPRDRARAGGRFALVIVLYAAGRAAIDGARGDLARDALGLTTSQGFALAAVGLVVAVWFGSRRSGVSDRVTRGRGRSAPPPVTSRASGASRRGPPSFASSPHGSDP